MMGNNIFVEYVHVVCQRLMEAACIAIGFVLSAKNYPQHSSGYLVLNSHCSI